MRGSAGVARGLIPILLLAAGCAIPGLPEEQATTPLTVATLHRVQQLYFWEDRLDQRLLVGALDALELRFDSVRFAYDEDDDPTRGVLFVGDAQASVPVSEKLDPEGFRKVLARALHFVARHIPDEANRDEDSNLEQIALRGALAALDRYSTIFSGQHTDDFKIRLSGKLRGIGARIGRRDGNLTAVRVFPGSPADKGGLQDGDALLYIDGDPTRPLTVTEAVARIRGKPGTQVVFRVLREEEEFEVAVTRGEVRIPTVETEDLGEGIGYARITEVSRATSREFREKVSELGAIKGLVLDLRGNTGGAMQAASQLADFFLSGGMIFRIVDRSEGGLTPRGNRSDARPPVAFRMPVVVLVDSSTASAAEILSGAIRTLDHVTLLGQKTFGKGVIQRVVPLPEKNLLKLTVGEYLLSGDRVIHEKGIDPDIELFPVPAMQLARLSVVPEDALPYLRKRGEDDRFPVELAQQLLLEDHETALEKARERADLKITRRLGKHDIAWHGGIAPLDGGLPLPLEVELESAPLRGGEKSTVRIHVANPNSFEIVDAWATLVGRVPFLNNRLAALGAIPSGGTAVAEIEVEPDQGLSVNELPVTIHIASGPHALQTEETLLRLENSAPVVQITVTRIDPENLSLTLRNDGCCSIGEIRVALRGGTRSLEDLGPGATETVELPVSGDSEEVFVYLGGAGVSRQIAIPIPDQYIETTTPVLRVERVHRFGQQQVRIDAETDEGLSEGWIALDGQKEVYVAWGGRSSGTLRAELEEGEHVVTTKVKMPSGIAILDTRGITAD
jgi:carboxyl-terminal processing protease